MILYGKHKCTTKNVVFQLINSNLTLYEEYIDDGN